MAKPAPKTLSVWDIPRNDVAACERFYRSKGSVTPVEMKFMLRLQDDQRELLDRAKDWKSAAE